MSALDDILQSGFQAMGDLVRNTLSNPTNEVAIKNGQKAIVERDATKQQIRQLFLDIARESMRNYPTDYAAFVKKVEEL